MTNTNNTNKTAAIDWSCTDAEYQSRILTELDPTEYGDVAEWPAKFREKVWNLEHKAAQAKETGRQEGRRKAAPKRSEWEKFLDKADGAVAECYRKLVDNPAYEPSKDDNGTMKTVSGNGKKFLAVLARAGWLTDEALASLKAAYPGEVATSKLTDRITSAYTINQAAIDATPAEVEEAPKATAPKKAASKAPKGGRRKKAA